MTEPILCLVCLCLLVWVAVLKSELAGLKQAEDGSGAESAPNVASRSSGVKGSRSFTIG